MHILVRRPLPSLRGYRSSDSAAAVFNIGVNTCIVKLQAKQEYQKVMIQLMEERQQHEAAVAEYKQVHTEHYDCVVGLFVDTQILLGFRYFNSLMKGI